MNSTIPLTSFNSNRKLSPIFRFEEKYTMQATPWLDRSRLYILFHQLSFLLTGLITTLGVQWFFYIGAATADNYLVQLSQYGGMVLVGILIPVILAQKRRKGHYKVVASSEEDEGNKISMEVLEGDHENHNETIIEAKKIDGPIQHRSVFKLALLDLVANFCVTFGFSVVGSGMYQVIYSSVVIWCAILTYFFMGRTLTRFQWLAIFGTSAGLALSSLGNFGSNTDQDHGAAKLMAGTIMTLGGTFFYSCVYVYSDYIMSKQVPPPLPARVCFMTGLYATFFSVLWVAVYTVPRWDSLMQIDSTVSTVMLLGMYVLVTVSNATHSWNYYELIERTGNVATGILQGLRAILVYVLSHVWYCGADSAQCFTAYKGCGSVLVIGCVLLFTVGGKTKSKK